MIQPHHVAQTGTSLQAIRALTAAYPRQTLLTVAAIFCASVVEGIGIGMLLPLLEIVMKNDGSATSSISRVIVETFQNIGITPTIGSLLTTLVIIMILKTGLTVLAMWQAGRTTAFYASEARLEVITKIMQSRWDYLISQPLGHLTNTITTETQRAASCYLAGCRILVVLTQAVVYSAVALLISWQVTLAAVLVGGLTFLALHGFVRLSREAGARQTYLMTSFTGRLVDAMQGIKPIKAMGVEERLTPLLATEIRSLRHVVEQQVLYKEGLNAMHGISMLLVLAVGGYVLLENWHVEIETLIVIAALFLRTTQSLGGIQKNLQSIATTEAAYWHLRAMLDELETQRESFDPSAEVTFDHTIELRNVSFGYAGRDVLRDVSMVIPSGSFVTVTGVSGAGKTTLVDVIIGLLRPRSGQVLLDGHELAENQLHGWRQLIGYVPQEMFLFHESIMRNVTLGDDRLSKDDVKSALEAAGAWEFVAGQPQGLDTVVGERGSKLSGGQRQRIAIARALVRKPGLLVLDEATTALDPETERAICATLRDLRGSVTVLAISHQPAIVRAADLMFEVKDGDVIERTPSISWAPAAQGGLG